jgi:hypothetical protein
MMRDDNEADIARLEAELAEARNLGMAGDGGGDPDAA